MTPSRAEYGIRMTGEMPVIFITDREGFSSLRDSTIYGKHKKK